MRIIEGDIKFFEDENGVGVKVSKDDKILSSMTGLELKSIGNSKPVESNINITFEFKK